MNSYWEHRFKGETEQLIMLLMGKLGVTQLDFTEAELKALEGRVFIGFMDNKFRLNVLDKDAVVIGGDCEF